jgi:hypothetical protein
LAGFEDEDDEDNRSVKPKAPVTYQVFKQPTTGIQEEEFAKAIAAGALPGRGRLAAIAVAGAGS